MDDDRSMISDNKKQSSTVLEITFIYAFLASYNASEKSGHAGKDLDQVIVRTMSGPMLIFYRYSLH